MEYISSVDLKLSNGRKITFCLKTWRLIILNTDCIDIKTTSKDEEIESIHFDDIFSLSVNNVISVHYQDRTYSFRINHIIYENNQIYLAETLRNITTRFILPVLRKSKEEIGLHYLLSSYLFTNKDKSGRYLYLWYRYVDDPEYKALEENLKQNQYFVKMYDITKDTTLFKFAIPAMFLEGIKLIRDGKYSKITNELKRTILKFNEAGLNSDLGNILYRNSEAVKELENILGVQIEEDMDIFKKMSEENETFTFTIIPN